MLNLGNDASRVPAVDKSWRIINYIASHPDATNGELSASLDISKSTVSDIVRSLCQASVLVRGVSAARLRLGPALIAMGVAARRQMPERNLIRDILRSMAQEWGCNIIVAQLVEHTFTFVIVESIPAPGPGALVAPVGTQLSFSAPAIGRAYLAGLGEKEAENLVRRWRDHVDPGIDLTAFLEPLRAARERGYATTLGEYLPEHHAVAVPVKDRNCQVKYVLVLAGYPRQLPSERLTDAGKALIETAGRLGPLIG